MIIEAIIAGCATGFTTAIAASFITWFFSTRKAQRNQAQLIDNQNQEIKKLNKIVKTLVENMPDNEAAKRVLIDVVFADRPDTPNT